MSPRPEVYTHSIVFSRSRSSYKTLWSCTGFCPCRIAHYCRRAQRGKNSQIFAYQGTEGRRERENPLTRVWKDRFYPCCDIGMAFGLLLRVTRWCAYSQQCREVCTYSNRHDSLSMLFDTDNICEQERVLITPSKGELGIVMLVTRTWNDDCSGFPLAAPFEIVFCHQA